MGISDDLTITAISGSKENLQAALDEILVPKKLAWGLRDDVIYVTTPERAMVSMFETRVYKVLRSANGNDLVKQITSQIEPSTWSEHGASGAIQYWSGGALVVSQMQGVHRLLQKPMPVYCGRSIPT